MQNTISPVIQFVFARVHMCVIIYVRMLADEIVPLMPLNHFIDFYVTFHRLLCLSVDITENIDALSRAGDDLIFFLSICALANTILEFL